MSLPRNTVLQIVPHQPGTFDGVGDYALNLARSDFMLADQQRKFWSEIEPFIGK